MKENLTSNSAIVIDGELVENTENITFEQTREFAEVQSTYSEDKVNFPTFKDFNLNIDGSLRIKSNVHKKLMLLPDDILIGYIYVGGDQLTEAELESGDAETILEDMVTGGLAIKYQVPIYVENFSITGAAGDMVKFSSTFKKGGAVTIV